MQHCQCPFYLLLGKPWACEARSLLVRHSQPQQQNAHQL